jgi:hypothetical protein
MTANNKRLSFMLLGSACLLLLPLVAMQFTDAMQWSAFDFMVAAVLLLGACFTFEFFARRGHTTAYRVTVGVVIAMALLIVWLELAVGIFGSPWAGS